MLVQDAMTKDPVVCTAETPLRQVVALFRKHHIGGLPVMEGKELVGIITESDLISLLETERISDDLWLPSPFEVIEIPIREYINWEKTKHALTNIGDMPAKKIDDPPGDHGNGRDGRRSGRRPHAEGGYCTPAGDAGENMCVGIITRADIINAIGSAYSDNEEAGE